HGVATLPRGQLVRQTGTLPLSAKILSFHVRIPEDDRQRLSNRGPLDGPSARPDTENELDCQAQEPVRRRPWFSFSRLPARQSAAIRSPRPPANSASTNRPPLPFGALQMVPPLRRTNPLSARRRPQVRRGPGRPRRGGPVGRSQETHSR